MIDTGDRIPDLPLALSSGTTASLSNTPQAKDDYCIADEGQIRYFDVMSNDLGGNAKVLWSIDNTSDDGATDLVAKDVEFGNPVDCRIRRPRSGGRESHSGTRSPISSCYPSLIIHS